MEKDIESLKRDLKESMTRALVQFRLLESRMLSCRLALKDCERLLRDAKKLKEKA